MTTLRIHDEIKISGEAVARWRVVDPVVRDGVIKLYDRQTNTEVFEKFDTINTNITWNKITVLRSSPPQLSVATQADPELFARIEEAQRGLKIVEAIQSRYGLSFSAAYDEATGARGSPGLCMSALPSKPTLYRYLAESRSGRPVLRGDKNKGNRNPRYTPQVNSLVETCADLYLVPGSTWNISDLTDHINAEAQRLKLDTPGKISSEYVRKVILVRKTMDPDAARMSVKDRAAARSVGGQRIQVALPFERVEQDTVHLPFKVLVNGNVADNIHLVHAIDCATGVVVGWTLVVGSPSESDGLRCMESVLFSKRDAFNRLGLDAQTTLDVFGTPYLVVLDNGPEGKGQRMSRLGGLGIRLQYCKSRHPHEKPFVERLNKALKRALQRLAGSTRHNDKDGIRDPVQAGDRLMTLDELEWWIVRWYYESWAKHELERHVRDNFVEPVKLGRTPEARWTTISRIGYPPRTSPSLAQWQMTCFEHHQRKLNRKTGITYEGLEYVGPHLKHLIKRFGENTVKCLVDPEDYRQIFVYTAEDEPLVALVERFARPESPAYSFAEMKLRATELKPQKSTDPVSRKFDEDMRQAAIAASSARAQTSRTARNQIATRTTRETDAVNRASKKPLNPSDKDTFVNTEQDHSFSLGPVPELRVVNRSTGEAAQ